MPRRREVPKREILPDPEFGNVELSKFMNVIMEGVRRRLCKTDVKSPGLTWEWRL